PAKASCPPGSPEGPDDSPVSPQSPEGPEFSPPPPSRDSGLRRSSEGVLQPPTAGQGMGELGGSLSALPRPGDPLSEPSLGSESSWSLSQSFEWTFPSRGARRLATPPRSPIRETPDSGLSEEGESDGEDPGPCTPCSRGDSGSEEPSPAAAGSRGAEGPSCPGGPVAQHEAEGLAEEEEEEGEAERDATVPCSPLCVTEPGWDPAEPKPPAQPGLLIAATPLDLAPPDPATAAHSLWAPVGDCPMSLQGPGGPGQTEGSLRGPDPHTDPGWLTELLASPGPHAAGHGSPDAEGPEDLLGWSRKDLCSEFGIGRPRQAGTFDWTHEAVARERDWPSEVERDREFGTKSSWDSTRDGDRQDGPFGTAGKDWGSDYKGTELMGETRLSCSDWSKSHSTGESCLQDQDFGAGKPKWGTGYGLDSAGRREEMCSGKADWSSSYSVGHGQQRDEELSSRQPSWAGRYGSGDPESQDSDITPAWAGGYGTSDAEMDRELTPDWASKYSSRDAETKDKDFTLGWAGRSSTGDTGTPEKEFGPSRPAWESKYSTRGMESQDREFSPSRPAWTGEYSTQEMESQDREFSPSRPAEASEYSTRDMESQDREFSPSRPAWDSEYSTRDVETQDGEFSPSRAAWASEYSSMDTKKEKREFSPGRLSWTGECSIGQTELADTFGVRKHDLPGSHVPDPPAQEPGWGSTHQQERGSTDNRDWAEELGGAERHNQFGIIGTERVPDPSGAGASSDGLMPWAGGMRSGGLQEPLGDWHRDLSCSSSDATDRLGTGDAGGVGLGQTAWDQGLGSLPAPGSCAQPQEARVEEPGWSQDLDAAGWSVELRDAEAKRREWASAFGARCAARSRDFSAGEQNLGDDAGSADGSICLLDPSLPMSDAPADSPDVEPPASDPLSPTEEERGPPELAAAPRSPRASPLLPEAAGGALPDTESEEAPSDHLDGKRPPSWEEKRLSLGTSQPEGPTDHTRQEFTFLEDTEVLDSSMYRSKANLGRKRRHRAPALRPGATSEGDSWIFRDSTEPRPAHPAVSSDEEAAEEPKSRRVRASPSGKGVKVPLFPGLNTSVLKAKLRGRNRSAEEGALPGDSKAAPPKDPHVQRSKSCKIPGLSGKPLALPPKPEKSSG
ncbi:TB182 protein, partial [Herpetotheres cachinnans]|nr:TB182 protein [Herpetotheres cachinnans]